MLELPETGSCKDMERMEKRKVSLKHPLHVLLKPAGLASAYLSRALISCLTPGTSSNLSEPSSPILEQEHDERTSLLGPSKGLIKVSD